MTGTTDTKKSSPFNSPYQEFIYKSRYARWIDEENRRENWDETVERYLDFMDNHLHITYGYQLGGDIYKELYDAIYNLEVMPSMRSLMTAGKALARDNVAGYNCSYLPVDNIHAFDEAMYILLCGTGVGFSVERQYVSLLPEVPNELFASETTIVVADSKAGWAKSLRQLVALLYSGEVPKWDTSKVRPAGARLKTFGGRASGPDPLVELFGFVVSKFQGAKGRKLNSLECHDIMCKIGEVVVVGGVRRSAMISLSNLSDDRMRNAKAGSWWENNPQRALSNNSVAYTEKPDVGSFLEEWTSLYRSQSGERGIFSREASKRQAAKNGRRDTGFDFGTNPCSEIILRPKQFCNLTEVVVRATDSTEDLARKVRLAAILGTFQSTLTYFPYLSKEWKKNTEEERLLGLSLTGIMDNSTLNRVGDDLNTLLADLKNVAIDTNAGLASELGINPSTAITCVKPSGTVSQLVDSASGIHARHSAFYIRSVRADNKDPITEFLKSQGVYWEPDVMKPTHTTVFFFPQKAPEGAITRNDMTAIEQLELWKTYQEHWCEHKPSVTVTVREHEWPSVGGWVYENFDMVSGVSFLPHSEHTYRQAPYEECDVAKYEEFLSKTPQSIDWTRMIEVTDTTAGSQTAACGPDGCEIVDLV
jgi:ribonucleoside-diphosphate reductase alpha chain